MDGRCFEIEDGRTAGCERKRVVTQAKVPDGDLGVVIEAWVQPHDSIRDVGLEAQQGS
jgi:hypothetical protein